MPQIENILIYQFVFPIPKGNKLIFTTPIKDWSNRGNQFLNTGIITNNFF